MEQVMPFLILSVGTYLIIRGLRLKLGYEKWQYFSPWSRVVSNALLALPGGIALFLIGLTFIPGIMFGVSKATALIGLIMLVCGFGVFFLGLILSLAFPKLLKPKWLMWLEDEHQDILPLLIQDARKMGLTQWQRRVKKQEGLEEWVEEVQQKHRK